MLSLYNKLLEIKTFPQELLNILFKRGFQTVGTQSAERISLPVLKGSTPLDNTGFDLHPWRKLPTLWEELESTLV